LSAPRRGPARGGAKAPPTAPAEALGAAENLIETAPAPCESSGNLLACPVRLLNSYTKWRLIPHSAVVAPLNDSDGAPSAMAGPGSDAMRNLAAKFK